MILILEKIIRSADNRIDMINGIIENNAKTKAQIDTFQSDVVDDNKI